MLKHSTISTLLLLLVVYCLSCKTKSFDIDNAIDSESILVGELKVDTPMEKGKADWIYGYIMEQTRQLGLDCLQNGYKDFQLRIWLHGWLNVKKDLIVLSRTDGKWRGKLITATYKYNDSLQEHFIAKQESKEIAPKSGWTSFFKSLQGLKFFTLPDMNELPNYKRGDDGADLVFEIATLSKYRMFHYWSPEYNSDNFWQAKNMVLISKLVHEEIIKPNE
jgi:hypothetical protein